MSPPRLSPVNYRVSCECLEFATGGRNWRRRDRDKLGARLAAARARRRESLSRAALFGGSFSRVFRNVIRGRVFQLGVFSFGFLQDRGIRVGVFPQGEKILI